MERVRRLPKRGRTVQRRLLLGIARGLGRAVVGARAAGCHGGGAPGSDQAGGGGGQGSARPTAWNCHPRPAGGQMCSPAREQGGTVSSGSIWWPWKRGRGGSRRNRPRGGRHPERLWRSFSTGRSSWNENGPPGRVETRRAGFFEGRGRCAIRPGSAPRDRRDTDASRLPPRSTGRPGNSRRRCPGRPPR